jgi:hypothetical protein
MLLSCAAAPALSRAARTICLHHAVGEQEWQCVEQDPHHKLDHPVAMLQKLPSLLALILDTKQRQRHAAKEQEVAHADAVHCLLAKPLVAGLKASCSTHDPCRTSEE